MVTLCTRRSHDRGIGDGDDHQLWIGIHKYIHHDRNENTEGSPGGSGGKCQETCHDKNDRRQEVHKRSGALLYCIGYKYGCSQRIAAPRLSVIAFKVHAKVRIRIAGTMALKPSGRQPIQSLKLKTLRIR